MHGVPGLALHGRAVENEEIQHAKKPTVSVGNRCVRFLKDDNESGLTTCLLKTITFPHSTTLSTAISEPYSIAASTPRNGTELTICTLSQPDLHLFRHHLHLLPINRVSISASISRKSVEQNRKATRFPHDRLMSAARDHSGQKNSTRSKHEPDREYEPRPGHMDVGLCGVDVAEAVSVATSRALRLTFPGSE